MDISTFRWILIVVGVAIVAYIVLFGNPQKKRKPRASRKQNRSVRPKTRREPTLEADALDVDDSAPALDAEPPAQPELEIPDESTPPAPPPGPPPEKIVSLFLQARDNHRISGVDLLDAALKSGMVFGQQDIFHRVMDDEGKIVFSMANLTKPGHFDKTAWNTLETIGVTMFMTIPGPMNPLDAWDAMLATSRRISELLHTDLLDDQRSAFTRQREGQIREELREYIRSKEPEA